MAIDLGLPGCPVSHSIGGYGHQFALGEEDAERLLQRITREELALFYVRMPAQSDSRRRKQAVVERTRWRTHTVSMAGEQPRRRPQ